MYNAKGRENNDFSELQMREIIFITIQKWKFPVSNLIVASFQITWGKSWKPQFVKLTEEDNLKHLNIIYSFRLLCKDHFWDGHNIQFAQLKEIFEKYFFLLF